MSNKGRTLAISARSRRVAGLLPARSAGLIGAITIAIVLLMCMGAPVGAAARASHKSAVSSPYPAAAQYPRRLVRPSEYAHTSANGVGGVSSGSSTPASVPSNKAPSKTGKTTKAPAKKKPKPGLHGNPARALLAFQAMQQSFYIPGTGLYEGEPYSYLWPFSQAWEATVSVTTIPGQAASAASTNAHELKAR